jgi:hypothetical protein
MGIRRHDGRAEVTLFIDVRYLDIPELKFQ